ncbi:MAG: hypothetical protein ABSG04_05405 [Verrucomicrobiota bacterium]|jgi:DNA-binding GntR family transcriptional regulator
MTPITSVSSTANQQVIAALQAQMARYSQAANSQNTQASADYKALQAAIKSGDVSTAEAALARLQRDSRTTNSAAAKPAPASATANSPVASASGQAGSTGAAQPGNTRSINITA